MKDSWFFDIHEDTEEELATNLMEHGACTLDISSDEENAARERDLRGKENVPPVDDVSQTRTALSGSSSMGMGMGVGDGMSGEMDAEAEMKDIKARLHRASRRLKSEQMDEGAIEVDRAPLGEMPAEDFYAEEVVEATHEATEDVVVASGSGNEEAEQSEGEVGVAHTFDFSADVVGKGKGVEVDVEGAMGKSDGSGSGKARLLEPIEKVDAGWSVWESGSAKGDDE